MSNQEEQTKDKPNEFNAVYLNNLSRDVQDSLIREVFGTCGTIDDLRRVEKNGAFQGSIFLQFSEQSAADKAKALSGKDILGRPVVVDYAVSKTTRTITFEERKTFTIL